MTPQEKLEHAKVLLDSGNLDPAWDLCEWTLAEDPNHYPSLVMASYIAWKAKRYVVGYQYAKNATEIQPNMAEGWLNLGICAHDLWLYDDAEKAFRKSIQLTKDKAIEGQAWMNLAGLYTDFGMFDKAEKSARKALELIPYGPKTKANLGFAMLAQQKWEGWKYYSYSLGLSHRQKQQFNEEPDWDGSPGKTVILYGEQGLGDEISFASMIPDAVKISKKVIFSCEKKLEGLFRRSFPEVKVYGTRRAKEGDGVKWDKEDCVFDASLALGELGGLFRLTDESFPGTPYLVADPDRRKMWRALFDTRTKPVIGLAWTGGLQHTATKFRSLSLEDLLPILREVDAHWVCLQYKDASKEIETFRKAHPGIEIVQYGMGTLTADYDDTAAMVAELDMVLTVQTAIVHLCGAIGKECWVLLPKSSQWRYGESGDTTIWYKAVRLFRQRVLGIWAPVFGEVIGQLRKKFAERKAA